MTNEELISKYYDGNMQALYDLYEQNVGFIQSVAAAVAKDYKNYLRFSDTFEDLVQVGSLTFFEKLKAKNANEPEFIQAATEVLTSCLLYTSDAADEL